MLANPRWYPDGRLHVIPLLNLSLPGIDPNDIKKSLVGLAVSRQVSALLVCALLVSALLVCGLLVCGLLVSALLVFALLVCGLTQWLSCQRCGLWLQRSGV